jgi:hypothetical protein
VLAGQTPFGLSVPDQIEARRHGVHRIAPVKE